MPYVNMTEELTKKTRGQQFKNAERNVLIAKMLDILCEGYISTNAISKQLKISRVTVENYRPLVDDIIAKTKLDRNVIRNLQVRRTYELIEQLMTDLKETKDVKSRSLIYGSIYKFSSHLALITGLNVETHVNVDPTKLVIIRSNKRKVSEQIDEQLLGAGKELVNTSSDIDNKD
jgi:DNA mismatch repair ATPase MutL